MSADEFRQAFRDVFKEMPKWAREAYVPAISCHLDELEAAELFDAPADEHCDWLQARLAAWSGGSLKRVPPLLRQNEGESTDDWLDRMLSAHCPTAPFRA